MGETIMSSCLQFPWQAKLLEMPISAYLKGEARDSYLRVRTLVCVNLSDFTHARTKFHSPPSLRPPSSFLPDRRLMNLYHDDGILAACGSK
jgi:hypothetical protein